MAYDNRPNLNTERFEQSSGDTLNLCGCTIIMTTHGKISSNNGYQISGSTVFTARGTGLPSSIQIGHNAISTGNLSTTIGFGAQALAQSSIAIGCGNVSRAIGANIIGGYNNIICSGNTNTTLIGAQNTTLDGSSHVNQVVIPNLAILCIPSGTGKYLCRDATTGKIELAAGGATISGTANRIAVFNSTGNNISATTATFIGNSICNNDNLTIEVPETKNLYLHASDGLYTNTIILGKPTMSSSITSNFIQACGLANNINVRMFSRGNGQISFHSPVVYLGNNGTFGLKYSQLDRVLEFPIDGKICSCNGDQYSHDAISMSLMGGVGYANGGSGATVNICGGNANSTGTSKAGGSIKIKAGLGACGGADGRIQLCGLPIKSSETCVVYVDANGNLSTGVISGGTGGATISGTTNYLAKFNTTGDNVINSSIYDSGTTNICILKTCLSVGKLTDTTSVIKANDNASSTVNLEIRPGCRLDYVSGHQDGYLYLNPGRGVPYHAIYLGSPTFTNANIFLEPAGVSSAIGLYVQSKGNTSSLGLQAGCSSLVYLGPAGSQFYVACGGCLTMAGDCNLTIRGYNNASFADGRNVTICAGSACSSSGNTNGGNLVLCAGTGRGSGSNGTILMCNSLGTCFNTFSMTSACAQLSSFNALAGPAIGMITTRAATGEVNLSSVNSSCSTSISFLPNTVTVIACTTTSFQGVKYCADFSANFQCESLATVRFVNSAVSDCRLKTDFTVISGKTSALSDICGYLFKFNEITKCCNCCAYGFVAQEVEKHFPLAVSDDSREIDGVMYKGIDYKQLIPVLWNIIKEQEVRIQALENKI